MQSIDDNTKLIKVNEGDEDSVTLTSLKKLDESV